MQTVAGHLVPCLQKCVWNGQRVIFRTAPLPVECLEKQLCQLVVDFIEKSERGMGTQLDQFTGQPRAGIVQVQGNDARRRLGIDQRVGQIAVADWSLALASRRSIPSHSRPDALMISLKMLGLLFSRSL